MRPLQPLPGSSMALPAIMSPAHVSGSEQSLICLYEGQISRTKMELSTVFEENAEKVVVKQRGRKTINYTFCTDEEHCCTSCRRIQSVASQ